MTADALYRPDLSLRGKLRRRLVRLRRRRPAARGPERPWVSFTFDDAPETAVTAGAAVLERHGMLATFYIAAGLAGTTDPSGRYAHDRQVRDAAARGHEIGCHTFSHRDCGQASAAEVEDELDRNARAFAGWGLPPARTFAYPYGDVAAPVKAIAGRRFALARGVHPGRIGAGSDLAQAPAVACDGPDGAARAMACLRAAAARGGWLILIAHEVAETAGEFAVRPGVLDELASAARELGVEPLTVAEGARRLLAG